MGKILASTNAATARLRHRSSRIGAALLLAVAAGAGCRTAAPDAGSASIATGEVGAPAPGAALDRFLQAARTGDVGVMANLFGTSAGPIAAREPSPDVEKRMRAIQCYLTHDSARMVADDAGVGSRRVFTVELRQKELVRRTQFNIVPSGRGRWFVESFDINAVSDFCRPSERR